MFNNTFFAKEPWFLKVIYVLAFLGITYNLYLLVFSPKEINQNIHIITSVTFAFFLFRKFLNDKKRN